MSRVVQTRMKRLFVKTRQNEPLDLAVYALAALQVVGPHPARWLGALVARLKQQQGEALELPPSAAPLAPRAANQRTPARRGGWVDRWR